MRTFVLQNKLTCFFVLWNVCFVFQLDSSPWLSPIWDGSSSKTERLSSLEFIILKISLISLFHQFQIMHWSILNFNTPLVGHSPPPQPWHLNFWKLTCSYSRPAGPNAIPYPSTKFDNQMPLPKNKRKVFYIKMVKCPGYACSLH